MHRVLDESNYVLSVPHRMRDEIREKPDLFDPHAQKWVEEAISLLERTGESVITV